MCIGTLCKYSLEILFWLALSIINKWYLFCYVVSLPPLMHRMRSFSHTRAFYLLDTFIVRLSSLHTKTSHNLFVCLLWHNNANSIERQTATMACCVLFVSIYSNDELGIFRKKKIINIECVSGCLLIQCSAWISHFIFTYAQHFAYFLSPQIHKRKMLKNIKISFHFS